MQIKKSVVISIFAVMLLLPLASAGFFDFITGRGATTQGTNVSAELTSDSTPVIQQVIFTSPLDLVDGENSTNTSKVFTLVVYDLDGAHDIDITNTKLRVTLASCNSQSRDRNVTCTNTTAAVASAGNYVNFTCPIDFYYYDCNGSWVVNATAQDLNTTAAKATNDTATLSINPLYALTITPLAINFGTLASNETNKTSVLNNTINNTGNQLPIFIDMNSTDLRGETLNTYYFGATNFTAATSNSTTENYPCDLTKGTTLEAGSFKIVGNASFGTSVPYVNIDGGHAGQYAVNKYCIPLVPILPRQNYTTRDVGAWFMRANYV